MMSVNPITVHMTGSEWFETRAGGLNRYFNGLHASLSDRDDVAVTGAAFGDPPATLSTGVSWGGMDGGTLARYRASRRHLTNDAPKILDTHFSLYGPTARSYREKPAHVVHFQGPWAAESREAGAGVLSVRTKKAFESLRYRAADRLIVLSQPFKNLLVEEYKVDPSMVSIIPPGVDLTTFRFEPEAVDDAPRVLCVRRLERRMGIHVLIQSWRAVVDAIPEATLHIVGTGTYEKELKALSNELNLDASIVFHGRLDDLALREEYRASTITVVPSVALEGFGLIALESMAVGRVPIVTDVGGLPDGARGLDSSLVVPAGSPDALSDRIVSAVQGRRPSALEARRHAETYAWSVAADKHVELYRSLLA
jgi:glycosyltransferase involved in cell wall biosynthesis